MDLSHIDVYAAMLFILSVVIAISFHECAHAVAADKCGDYTARELGRITLLPTEHFDPLGFIMIVFMSLGGMGLGWGKPVPVNMAKLRHPRRDLMIIAAAGPLTNLALAVVVGLVIRLTGARSGNIAADLAWRFLFTNLTLFLFNLIPIAPLDGSKVLSALLPWREAQKYDLFMMQYGFMLLIGLVFLGRGLLGAYLGPPMFHIATILTGVSLV